MISESDLTTQSRLRALLRATQVVAEQLDLEVVLRRIIEMAVELAGAQYGALGVISPHGDLEQFIHVGIPDELVTVIGHLPEGHGLLGALIDDPRPIRIPQLTADPRSAGFPPHHPTMESFLGVPVRVRNKVFGNLYLTNAASGSFSEADEEIVTALAATAGSAIDNARLFDETKRRQALASASAEVTAALLSSEETDAVYLLASRALILADADLVVVALTSDDPESLVVVTARGTDQEEYEGAIYPLAGTLVGAVIESGQPRIIEERSVIDSTDDPAEWGPTIAVPLLAHGGALGALLISRRRGQRRFTEADLEIAADFAGQASVAIKMADARVDRQRMSLLEERSRISRDLHDHVIQQLFGAGLQLQSLVSRLPADSAERVEHAIGEIDGAIAEIRTAIFALSSPPDQKSDTFRHRLIDIVNQLGGSFSVKPTLVISGPVDSAIEGDLAHDVLAVVREALTNSIKHASAASASISIGVRNGEVEVTVGDNGVGIASNRRSGLANLELRASSRSGSFAVDSRPGSTVLTWVVPYGSTRKGEN